MPSEYQKSDFQTTEIITLWNEIHAKTNDKKLAGKYLQESAIYNQIARQNNQIIIISNFKNHSFITLSDNFDDIYESGKSKEDWMKWGAFYFSRAIPFEQNKTMIQISLWFNKVKKENISNPSYKQTYCGWKFKCNQSSKTKYLSAHLQGLEYSSTGEPVIVMTTVSDVTHLLRENPPFWSNIKIADNPNEAYLYHSDKNGINKTEILTNREIEFLKAFGSGLELKEIAEKMQISYKTADAHRANLLHALGVRNPMAGIEIAKKAGII